MKQMPGPMLLEPVGKDYIWGGVRLKTEYNKSGCTQIPLAETWECSVHPDGPSRISTGIFEGMTLNDVLQEHPEYLGTKISDNKLPILVKFIDAAQKLSVQVHPGDEYARVHEGQNGKTEMWYVLDAVPGATLIYGFAHNITERQLRDAVRTGNLSKHLQKIKVRKGDVFYIPAGTIHAIGAGTVIAEIQESSNVTYRVYDYGRKDKTGKPRETHLDKAVDVLDMNAAPEIVQHSRLTRFYPGCARQLLCRCKYFDVERVEVNGNFGFSVLDTSFQVLLCLDGAGDITSYASKESIGFSKGSCIFMPADTGRCTIYGKTELLKIRC